MYRKTSYFQNMIENIILTSYQIKLWIVASLDGHVAKIQITLHNKLKDEVSQHFLAHKNNILSYEMAFV